MPAVAVLPHVLPAAYVLAQVFSCTPAVTPQVEITFDNRPHITNNMASLAQLQRQKTGAHIAYRDGDDFTTVGTTNTQITSDMDVGFQMLSNALTGGSCLSLSHIRLNVTYAPEVMILRDYRPGSCRYRTTLEHEMQHVKTDIRTLRDFIPVIRDDMQKTAARLKTVGPIKRDKLQDEQDRMQEILQATFQSAIDRMESERQARQRKIDTREEYVRLSAACPHEPQIRR